MWKKVTFRRAEFPVEAIVRDGAEPAQTAGL